MQGKNGVIESATITAKCSPPQKQYARDLDISVKASMDSLKFTPAVGFDAIFSQKVKQLREYSSKGLDIDLLTFRICEMANNRGFTSEQTYKLIEKAIELWGSSSLPVINQIITSNNQTGGITAGNVYVEPRRRVLNIEFSNKLIGFINSIRIDSVILNVNLGDAEAYSYCAEIKGLLENSYPKLKVQGIDQVVQIPPAKGVGIDTSLVYTKRFLSITVGTKL